MAAADAGDCLSARGCIRTGFCCRLLHIPHSPRALREAWVCWHTMSEEKGKPMPADIWSIYPMLAGRCLGKVEAELDDGTIQWRYAYGPCRNLDVTLIDGRPTPTCAIHENKPVMCRDFPFYGRDEKLKDPNPGFARGCGFNADATAGRTEAESRAELLPLMEDEQ